MSDRADFLAGIAASGYGSMYEIYGDFGTFSGPYPDPSPPHGSFGASYHDMLGDYNSSDDDFSMFGTHNKAKSKEDNRIHAVHRYLGKPICEPTQRFSADSTQNLARIARDARFRYRSSAKKRLQHLEWAAKTLHPAALTHYVHLFRVDHQMDELLGQSEHKEELTGERSVKAKLSQDSKQKLMSRPLRDVPFNGTDRKLVEGLLSLLMRISESVARRAWPQLVFSEPQVKLDQVRRARHEMERDELLLDELRGRIELGWPDYIKSDHAGGLSNTELIDKVQALQEEVLGIALLPSETCIKRIINIVNKTYPRKDRISHKKHHAMPAKIKEQFKKKLHLMYLYDKWRATNPPDSERFSDVVTWSP